MHSKQFFYALTSTISTLIFFTFYFWHSFFIRNWCIILHSLEKLTLLLKLKWTEASFHLYSTELLFKRALHLFYIDRSEALVSMAEVGAPFCWCVPLSCFTYIQKCLGLPGSVSELLVCKTLNYISPKIKNLNPNDLKRSRYTLKFKAGNEERKTWRIFLSEPHANAWWNVSPF